MPIVSDVVSARLSFLEHLEVERNVSRLTIRNYGLYLQRFVNWFQDQGLHDITQLDPELLRSYRVFLNRYQDELGRTLSKKTQGYYLIALRSWLKWLIKNDLKVLDPAKIDLPKGESNHMKFLRLEDVLRLFEQPNVATIKGLRDRTILETLFSTGLRVSELVSLNWPQLDLQRQEFGVIGKGRRPRVVFLSDRATTWLKQWQARRQDEWLPVFIRLSRRKEDPMSDGSSMRLTARSVQRLVDSYCRKAHLPVKISPHGLRHSFATDLLGNGAGLREVQELLGHKNVATTQIYTHVTQPKLKQVHQKYHTHQD